MEKYFAGIKDQVQSVNQSDLEGSITNVINAVLGIIGVIAVVVIIIGGMFYATSQGDPGKATKGKNCIMGGIIGLIICLLAFAIVNFVLNAI